MDQGARTEPGDFYARPQGEAAVSPYAHDVTPRRRPPTRSRPPPDVSDGTPGCIVAHHGVKVDSLPAPTRRAYQFLRSVDVDTVAPQVSKRPPRRRALMEGTQVSPPVKLITMSTPPS